MTTTLKHRVFLEDKIYHIHGKWPQFKIMFKALDELLAQASTSDRLLLLERAYFFGGQSIFAPLLSHLNCTIIDCVSPSLAKRHGAQKSWVEHPDFITNGPHLMADPAELGMINSNSQDWVFVPNIVHHIKNQRGMFDEWWRVLKPGGRLLVFEGLVRELHHIPDDYLRYTPYGMQNELEARGFRYDKHELGSGVFDVIAYSWQMALEYLPDEERKEKTRWLFEEHIPYLHSLDARYKKNLVKPDKKFPMSYVVWATKL